MPRALISTRYEIWCSHLELHWTLSSSMQAESKYFKAMLEAVASYGAGYQPPTDKQLRSHLLVEAVDKLDKELTYLDPTIGMYGSTITCNGWSDAQMHPILNMLQVCPSGVRFVGLHRLFREGQGESQCEAVLISQGLCSGPKGNCFLQDAAYIAEKVGAAVEAAGEDCVDLVVTDLGYDNKQAGAILEQRWGPAQQQTNMGTATRLAFVSVISFACHADFQS